MGELAGLGTNTLYQLLWTLPRWDILVTKHMARHDTPMWYAAALLLAFGALYHLHRSVSQSGNQQALLNVAACVLLCCAVHTFVAWHTCLQAALQLQWYCMGTTIQARSVLILDYQPSCMISTCYICELRLRGTQWSCMLRSFS